ncbi:MAG: FoF1 ATP synthase subunit gamma [Eubacteriales bacterium]
MASLRELRKHLKSVNTTEQLAGAMKTVSAAKFSRISAVLDGCKAYADVCRDLMERFGSALSEAMPCADPDAPDCYVVFAANRGLCGGYNITLLDYADRVLAQTERPYMLVACGKMAVAHFAGRTEREFVFPDVPDERACMELFDYLRTSYQYGQVSSVHLIYQNFVNMLTQNPTSYRLLPMTNTASGAPLPWDDTIYVPDRATVLESACRTCVSSALYSILLESAAGTQAATLMAMRSAYDNAQESSANLETIISRKRQSEVTASVIETASDNNSMQ